MPGNYGYPYAPPCDGWFTPRRFFYGGRFQHYRLTGEVVDRWINATQVHVAPGANYGNPHARLNPVEWACGGNPNDTCGTWLIGGDANGLSAQQIEDTVNDIMACAGTDATHATLDHNCYTKSGTKDFRKGHKVGWAGVAAQKMWQGTVGFKDESYSPADGYTLDMATGELLLTPMVYRPWANQVKYLTKKITANYKAWATATPPSDTVVPPCVLQTDTNANRTATIGRTSGVQTLGGSESLFPPSTLLTEIDGLNLAGAQTEFLTWDMFNGTEDDPSDFTGGDGTVYSIRLTRVGDVITRTDVAVNVVGTFTGIEQLTLVVGGHFRYTSSRNGLSEKTFDITVTETKIVLSRNTKTYLTYDNGRDPSDPLWVHYTYLWTEVQETATAELSNPYSANDVYNDWLAAMATWDLSDGSYPLRTDEQLANVPLIVYDEIGPNAPTPNQPLTMDNYGTAQISGAWAQMPWHDPNDLVWTFGGSFTMPGGFTGGGSAVPHTGLHNGQIISHSRAGSDRHFWFGSQNMARDVAMDTTIHWNFDSRGAWSQTWSDGHLPETALRWQSWPDAQSDSGSTPPRTMGNMPQAWLREIGGVLMGGKYIEAKEVWKSVNFARPYGADKWAVDQTTVCCIVSGTGAGGSLVVTPTNNAVAPTAGTVMIGGDGIYPVTIVSAPSGGNYTLTLGAKICDLAAGTDIGSGFVGKMRFWSAPPFGCEPVSAVYTSLTTLTFAVGQQFWLGLATVSVDLYAAQTNAQGIVCATAAPLATGVTMTIVDTTHATVAGDKHPAAFVVPAGMKPWFDDDGSKGTVVFAQWSFQQRPATSGGSVPGCTGVTLKTDCIPFVPCCAAMVGIVPFYSPLVTANTSLVTADTTPLPAGAPVENFANMLFTSFPTQFAFDDAYGSAWQAAVYTAMTDPFWQQPFAPDCAGSFGWVEDDGSGQMDDDVSTPPVHYFPHRRLVESRTVLPSAGWIGSITTAPALAVTGLSLIGATVPPPFYPNGIPIKNDPDHDNLYGGSYADVATPFGFYARYACNPANRYTSEYGSFTGC